MEGLGDSHFQSDKTRILAKVDLSRKGSVDEPIKDLVEYINEQDSFYTTSSCSGRLAVFSEDMEQRKKHCSWLLVSHEEIDLKQLVSVLHLPESTPESRVTVPHLPQSTVPHPPQSASHSPPIAPQSTEQTATVTASGYAFFKFEPFILHTMCRSLSDAQTLLQVAIASGFRNSGITFGRKGKILLAVRSTHSLEVPLCYQGELIVTQDYLQHILMLGNMKLRENKTRVDRFYQELRKVLEARKERLVKTKHGVSDENYHGSHLKDGRSLLSSSPKDSHSPLTSGPGDVHSPLTSSPARELDIDIGHLFS